jgi:hypothetical protein
VGPKWESRDAILSAADPDEFELRMHDLVRMTWNLAEKTLERLDAFDYFSTRAMLRPD